MNGHYSFILFSVASPLSSATTKHPADFIQTAMASPLINGTIIVNEKKERKKTKAFKLTFYIAQHLLLG